jgi:hypothetical protein
MDLLPYPAILCGGWDKTCVVVFGGKIAAGRRYSYEEGRYLQCGSDTRKRGRRIRPQRSQSREKSQD